MYLKRIFNSATHYYVIAALIADDLYFRQCTCYTAYFSENWALIKEQKVNQAFSSALNNEEKKCSKNCELLH